MYMLFFLLAGLNVSLALLDGNKLAFLHYGIAVWLFGIGIMYAVTGNK